MSKSSLVGCEVHEELLYEHLRRGLQGEDLLGGPSILFRSTLTID